MKISEKQNITETEFFVIIENIFKDLFKALMRVEESTHHQIIRKRNVRPASRVKKVGRQSPKWVNKNSRHYDQELKLPEKMLAVEKLIRIICSLKLKAGSSSVKRLNQKAMESAAATFIPI